VPGSGGSSLAASRTRFWTLIAEFLGDGQLLAIGRLRFI
jgi:hypothetical protein